MSEIRNRNLTCKKAKAKTKIWASEIYVTTIIKKDLEFIKNIINNYMLLDLKSNNLIKKFSLLKISK